MNIINWLLDATSFVTRNNCGKWPDWLISVNQVANFLIFISYMTIPLSLVFLWRMAKGKGDAWIILMFVVFILFCGLTHLMDVLAFSWAPYRLFTFIDCITAASSIPTAILLPGVLKRVFDKE